MIIPKLLVIIAANKALAGIIIGHFPGLALEWRNIIEKIEREEYHGCNNPFECEDEKEKILISVLSSYFS